MASGSSKAQIATHQAGRDLVYELVSENMFSEPPAVISCICEHPGTESSSVDDVSAKLNNLAHGVCM